MSVSTIKIGQKSVIVVDCSNMNLDKIDEMTETLKSGSALVKNNPEKSVYIITNVTNTKFNSDVTAAFKAYATANTKYIKESVLVGISGLQAVMFSAIKALTKREYQLVDTMEAAKKYLETI